jgi:hypothetical protein
MSTASTVNTSREWAARIIWAVCLIAAIVLALGALLVAVKANTGNPLVELINHLARWASVGLFSRTNGIKHFTGHNAVVKNALFNWGIGAIIWLIVGRVVSGLVRPRH